MEYTLVGEGLKFMVLGMLIVLVFLLLLVQVMKWQAKIINKYFPEKEPVAPTTTTADSDEESRRTAAIIAAVTEFRKQ
ncbi:OadG family protein [Sulfurovum riftiae]|uniref:Probable oxaloacetate decarboxylase gamma chain n=1 Tax=Sulfurovum riftiae TaxID=1630136 RepID=A0A151CJM3_9BACT|nr:OadG family transporter subunit [Sulfurovum riftiae]KYJ87742.1 Na+-transporting oxaloacetate decarboxylase subunit gamma [Sulfurovum riftiae]